VMRCLEKAPADRWQSADELLAELEAMTTPSQGQPARPGAPREWSRVLRRRPAVSAIALLLVAGGWFWWRARTPARTPVSPSRVAVLPFSIHGGGDIAYLGEGMVNLLGASLDGASDLHSVDPRALLAAASRAGTRSLDPTVGSALARGLGAGLYVTGDVVQAGERLRIEASLYDQRGGAEPTAHGTVEGPVTQLFGLVDALAAQLVANRTEGPGARVTRLAAVTTTSLPALKAYLEGDRRFRAQQFAEARDAFQRAVAIDTLFALAYYRLSITAEWLIQGDLARDAAEQAVRHSDRLSDHDRALLEALRATRRGDAATAERLYLTILALYPDDVEAWFQLGEVRFHYGPREHGRPIGESREAWERVLRLEPGNAGAAIHLARVAAVEGKRLELDSLVRLVLTASPQGERVVEMEALRAAVVGDSAAMAQARADLRQASDLGVPLAGYNAVLYGGNYARAAEFVRVLTEPSRSSEVRALGHVYLAHIAAAFGRWHAADRELAAVDSLDHGTALEYRALFAAVPFRPTPTPELEALRRRLVAWNAAAMPSSRLPSLFFTANNGVHRQIRAYLLGLLSARLQDAGAAERYAVELERLGGPPDVETWARDLAQDVRAASAAARGDARHTLDALGRASFNSWYILAMGSPFYLPPLERYRLAEALAALGPSSEALGWYHSFADYSLFAIVYVAPGYLRSGELYERLGQPARAATEYARFVRLWSDCDPELQPEVARARVALARVQRAGSR
jgi:tetratricopeptide (TPR) repeat protein